MKWPYQWYFTERFLRQYDSMIRARNENHGTAVWAIDWLLSKEDRNVEGTIQHNSRVPDNRRSS